MARITHLHLKDVDARREWVGLGQGVCDFPAVFKLLEGARKASAPPSAGYDGWVVAEEESEEARKDGAAAIGENREYLHSIGY